MKITELNPHADLVAALLILLVFVLGFLMGWKKGQDVPVPPPQFIPVPVKCDCMADTVYTFTIGENCRLEPTRR